MPMGKSRKGREEGKEKVVVVRVQDAPPRAFQIGWEDRKEFGATRGCAGCNSWEVGRGRAPHSKECVARFEALLKGRARFENQKKRMAEYLEEKSKKRKEEEGLAARGEEGDRKRKAEEGDDDRRTKWGGS